MCGIAGIFDYDITEGRVDGAVLHRMRETLRHRGPDDAGQWISPDRRVGLATRRLAILDIEGGAQPMLGRRGEVLVFNGEIYNYPLLRRVLEADGARFRTSCDTEVILPLYERHGADCLKHLNGMFAFALWDPALGRLLLARDRIGEKPLYWTTADGTLVFASEIKALFEHPKITPSVNAAAIGPYLTNLVTTPPETLYADIWKLAPGHMVICDRDGARTTRWWNLFDPREFVEVPREQASETVRKLLDRSVHDRLLADVPVGVLLSGGLDSTTLLALLRERARGMASFSVGFPDHPHLDERDQARRVARELGSEHHEIAVDQRQAIAFLPKLIYHQDEPLADPVCIPLHFVCKLARDSGVPVVLAGEGSDELFWGYPSYRRVLRRRRQLLALMRMPRSVRAGLAALVPPERHANLRQLLESLASDRPLPLHMPLGLPRHHRTRVLADPTWAERLGWLPSDVDPNGSVDPFTQLAFDTQEYEFGLRLPELLLMRIDRFSMANSVEARVPFLDPDLVRYVYRLAIPLKFQDDVGKVVLRDAVADVVPEWVIRRPKQGFGAPVREWMGGELGTLFEAVLNGEAVRRYFNVEVLRRALGKRRGTLGWALWPILNFALWHRCWIEGESVERLVEPLIAPQVAR
jgi:asparagine synthase (glutamine-hydrolysing)